MPHDWTAATNPLQSPADSTYWVTPTTLTIKDSGKDKKSVVEDLQEIDAVGRRVINFEADISVLCRAQDLGTQPCNVKNRCNHVVC
jgi:hypothetical protein